jgi:hypothetical protein
MLVRLRAAASCSDHDTVTLARSRPHRGKQRAPEPSTVKRLRPCRRYAHSSGHSARRRHPIHRLRADLYRRGRPEHPPQRHYDRRPRLTRPWTVTKGYRRDRNVIWYQDNCNENNRHVIVGKGDYFVGADGYLMPTRKNQPPPDLRYFNRTKK